MIPSKWDWRCDGRVWLVLFWGALSCSHEVCQFKGNSLYHSTGTFHQLLLKYILSVCASLSERCTWSSSKARMWTFGETWRLSPRMRSANWENWRPLGKDRVQFCFQSTVHVQKYMDTYTVLFSLYTPIISLLQDSYYDLRQFSSKQKKGFR